MNICVISGPSNIGKTETIELIDDIFKNSDRYISLYSNRSGKYIDFESVYRSDNKIVGLISIGDTKSDIENAFNEINTYNIDYLICTSRSKGKTVKFIESLSDNVVRIYKPYFSKDNNYNENLNINFAQYIYGIFLKLFN